MVVQLEPVYPPSRRIRVNTVAFDVECVLLMTPGVAPDPVLEVVNGIAFRKADIAKYLLPHQMANLTTATDNERLCYLTVVPYGVSFDLTHDTEIDPNLSRRIDDDLFVSPNDEVDREVMHYKHHTRCVLQSETCFTIPVGINLTTLFPFGSIFFTAPSNSSYAWPWFNLTSTVEELVIIPVPDFQTAYTNGDLYDVELTCNLGHVVPDCSVRNCIYSTYQVIRGNEYGTRESILDYLPIPD